MQILSITPPIDSASNHILPRNEPSEIMTAQSPGADFSLKTVPKRSPTLINIIADGIIVIRAVKSPDRFIGTSLINEIINDTENDINVCTVDIISIGRIYPHIKSADFMGLAYILTRNAPLLSLDTFRAVKSMIKVCPKIAIPPAKLSILKIVMPDSGGMLSLTKVMTISIIIGNPRQNI